MSYALPLTRQQLEQIERIADRLIGQCVISLDEAIEDETHIELAAHPSAFLEAIDDKVFCCDECNWYYGTDELNDVDGSQLCDQCAGDRDE